MPCDTTLKAGQTISQRKDEVRKAIGRIGNGLANGSVKVKIGPQGAVAFIGVTEADRDGVTDACAYRSIMVSGSAFAKAAILRAEQLAGRSVDKRVIGQGVHSHDGGKTWHEGH